LVATDPIAAACCENKNALTKCWHAFTGVASYGALGHVPPRLTPMYFFSVV